LQDVRHIPKDNYVPPELNALFTTNDRTQPLLAEKIDVWGFGCFLFELVTKKVLENEETRLCEMGDQAMSKVPSRFGDIVKHILRRCLKEDPKKRASTDEILGVLTQRLDIIDAQNNETKRAEEEAKLKDEAPKLTQKELLMLHKKKRRGGGGGGVAGAGKSAAREPAVVDDDLSVASALLEDASVTSGDSSKIRDKLLAAIEEANRLQTEEGWKRTKERVAETLRRRWWNALTDHERFIYTHKKLTRRQSIIKACRRKLSIKGALFNWWTSDFVGVFVCHILKTFEERDNMLEKFKGNSFLVGGGHRDIEEKSVGAQFSDDERSLASSVFSNNNSVASSSVASSVMNKRRVNMVSLEQGLLDTLMNFDYAIPLYEGYDKLMNVKNGVYFPVGITDPRIKEREKVRMEEKRKRKRIDLVCRQC
jgi:serine/threonine protein kinase